MVSEIRDVRAVMEDLSARERVRRLRNWRRMIENYANGGAIERRYVKCPKCGRIVDLLCPQCVDARSD